MKGFFSDELRTRCGIPVLTLEGTAEDWRSIARRVQRFRRLGLDFWIDALQPLLDEFTAAAQGNVNRGFWESIYEWQGPRGSGSAQITGWIVSLFLYLVDRGARWAWEMGQPIEGPGLLRNPWLGSAAHGVDGPGRDDFPSMPSKAPFCWKYLDRRFEMEFVGGLLGVAQDADDFTLRPAIGWAVIESGHEKPGRWWGPGSWG
ncbi:uncharacterized protein CMC5_054020 [Chondromyces crocatus]|uniref:Uncharacterized protein n=1 Tax=Chondromyces crocatus TaxID=52 RepID=A0A0K1EK55_CHOCO|nr:uncharacterized protein CMC5_054020 [Chondromyces crocatus]